MYIHIAMWLHMNLSVFLQFYFVHFSSWACLYIAPGYHKESVIFGGKWQGWTQPDA